MKFKHNIKSSFTMFFKPFTVETWASVFGIFIFYALILAFISHRGKKSGTPSTCKEDFTLWESLTYFSLAAIQFGPDKQPVSMGGKLLRQLWSTLYLIIVTTYTANLVALFSEASILEPVKSFYDVPDASQVQVFTFAKYQNIIRHVNHPVLNTLLEEERIHFVPTANNLTVAEEASVAAEKLNANHIWLDNDVNIDYLFEANENMFYTLDGDFLTIDYGFLVKKDWKYAQNVTNLISEYRFRGLLGHMNGKSRCRPLSRLQQLQTSAIGIDIFYGLFSFMFLGGLVAIFLSILQYRCCNAKIETSEGHEMEDSGGKSNERVMGGRSEKK